MQLLNDNYDYKELVSLLYARSCRNTGKANLAMRQKQTS